MRLRTLQQPTVVQEMLESLLLFLNRPPQGAERIVERTELPLTLQYLVHYARKEGLAWAAWRQAEGIHFYSAELALDLTRECGRSALRVTVFDEGGKVRELMAWSHESQDEWRELPH